MPRTTDDVDIIVPGESGLAVTSAANLQGSDVVWIGQSSGTVPKTATLQVLNEYFGAGNDAIKSQGYFIPTAGQGLTYIVQATVPTSRPTSIIPGGAPTALLEGDRWYDTTDGTEWIRLGTRWVSPLRTISFQPMYTYAWYNTGSLAWIGNSTDRVWDGLEALVSADKHGAGYGILLEYTRMVYFSAVVNPAAGFSYNCYVENMRAAMSLSTYYTEPRITEAMVLAVDPAGIPRGGATAFTVNAAQAIDWNPWVASTKTAFYQQKGMNTVEYRRQLHVPSSYIRVLCKDFVAQLGPAGQYPSHFFIGGQLYYRLTRE